MSTTYETVIGDTFETVARKTLGDGALADRVSRANPGVVIPLQPGTTLFIPDTTTPLRKRVAASNEDEVALGLDNRRFRFWSSIRVTRGIDFVDTVEFEAPFDSDVAGYRDAFRPFSYKPVDVTIGGEQLFTGTQVNVRPDLDSRVRRFSVAAYSRPGVLGDCTPPASSYPVEFNGQSLEDIARTLAEPFGIDVVFTSSAGAAFQRVAVDPGQTVMSFLTKLAQQRGLIISSDVDGRLLFRQSNPGGTPVARLRQGAPPLVSVRPAFSPQQYFSDITGLQPVAVGSQGSQFTVKNPFLAGVARPFTFKSPDTDGGDVQTSVEAKTGRMFANMVSYQARVSTLRDASGNLWQPDSFVQLEAPDAMVYSSYAFTLRSVVFEITRNSRSAILDLVLPGSFAARIPESLPWD